MRPLYETKQNLATEREIVDKYCKEFQFEAFKLPIAYRLDHLLTRDNKPVAVLEVKSRKERYGTYPTYMIAAAKVMEAVKWKQAFNLPVLLIVNFYDTEYITDLSCATGELFISGRHDRNDSQDIEPCLFIPKEQFAKVY